MQMRPSPEPRSTSRLPRSPPAAPPPAPGAEAKCLGTMATMRCTMSISVRTKGAPAHLLNSGMKLEEKTPTCNTPRTAKAIAGAISLLLLSSSGGVAIAWRTGGGRDGDGGEGRDDAGGGSGGGGGGENSTVFRSGGGHDGGGGGVLISGV
jgi:hypothetical protein